MADTTANISFGTPSTPAGAGANAIPSNARNPIPAYRTFAAHRSLFQNLYKDKIDLSNIPNDLKTMIMDQSTAKLSQYEPVKYVTRLLLLGRGADHIIAFPFTDLRTSYKYYLDQKQNVVYWMPSK